MHADHIHRGRPTRIRGVLPAILVMSVLMSGCFALTDERNHGIGLERNRANVLVYKRATRFLYDQGAAHGSAKARQILLDAAPDKIKISATQRIAICAVSASLCLTADQIGRVIVGWFRSDIRSRSDFWEALSYAGRNDRCLAWTFAPSRNLTHKDDGVAGCRTGVLV